MNPHAHQIGTFNFEFIDNDINEVINYCRNPLNIVLLPFCFTTNPDVVHDFCSIPRCNIPTEIGCKNSRQGSDYVGKLDHVVTGEECFPWLYVQSGYKSSDFPENNIGEALNYCRNPNNDRYGPWCYFDTGDGQFKGRYCAIPICNVPDKFNEIYFTYIEGGIVSTQFWFISELFVLYIFPVFLIVGTILNSLSIAVFTRPSLSSSTTSYLLILLAVCDTLSLYWGALPKWLRRITGLFLETSTNTTCKIYSYLGYIIKTYPGYILLVITLERAIAIIKPIEAKTICTKRNASIILFVVLVCISLLTVPILMYVKLVVNNINVR